MPRHTRKWRRSTATDTPHLEAGTTFRSRSEEQLALSLSSRGIEFVYEPCTFNYTSKTMAGICLDCGGKHVGQKRRYRPDFYIPKHNFYIELKGDFSSRDRSKMVAVRAAHPAVEFRLLLLADNKLSKSSTKRYSDWCKEHEWVWHLGRTAPDKWFA